MNLTNIAHGQRLVRGKNHHAAIFSMTLELAGQFFHTGDINGG
jgi:hypothetical protein